MDLTLSVLLINDRPDDAVNIVEALEKGGYTISWDQAETEEQLRAALSSHTHDLIISDYRLSSLSGLQAFEIFKEYDPDIPFIIISGLHGEEFAIQAMRCGVNDYLLKEQLSRLLPSVERALKEFKIRRAKRTAEQALKESEERYRLVAETASDAIITIDGESRMLYVNRAAEDIFGYLRAEMVGNELTMLMPESMKERHRKAVSLYLDTGNRSLDWSGFEIPARRKDGSEIIVHISFGEFPNQAHHIFTAIVRDITKSKAAEAALRRSEEDFRALVEATTQFVWTAEANGSSPELFKWFSEMCGKQIDSIEGLLSQLYPDERAPVEDKWKEALQQKSLFDRVCRFIQANGTICYLAARAVPMFDQDGSFRHWIGTFTDITERMVGQEALRQSETQLRTIVESVPECIKLLDTEGRLLKMNPSGLEMLQAGSFEQLRGQPVINIVTPAYRDAFAACIQTVVGGYPCELQFEIENMNGDRRWMDMKAVPIRDADNNVVAVLGVTRDETERRRSEQALRHSEERFRDLFENANDLIYTHDLEGKYTSLNRAGEMITGYSRDEIEGVSLRDVVAPEYVEKSAEMLRSKLAGDTGATSYEIEIITKDGRRVMLDLGTRLICEGGKPVGVQGIARDITERKRAELALRSSEHQLRIITDTVPSYITYIGADLKLRFANRAFLEWLGTEPNELIGKHLKDVIGELTFERIQPELTKVLSGETLSVERHLYRDPVTSKPGEPKRYARLSYIPEFDEDGHVTAFFTFSTDLTANKLAEDALKKSEEQLRIVTDTVPALIAYFDSDRICRFANRSYLEWLTKTPDEVIGKPLSEVQSEDSYRQLLPEIERALHGEEFTVERRAYLSKADGERKGIDYLRVSYVPDRNTEGHVVGYFAFAIDLTETKRAEEALRTSEEQLIQAQKLESVGRLAGGIAHDFNNMLTAINGYSDLTLRRMHPGDPLRHNIEEIRKAGERSAELTQQLLAFSRKQIMQPRVIELNRTISDLIPMFERLIGEDVQLSTSFARNCAKVNADAGQLSQVLLNLVVNARDSIPGGGSVVIETGKVVFAEETIHSSGTVKPGNYAMMAISDTGIGIDEETIKHIFEPFFTTKEIGKGTGLGLSTVHGIVHQSGGSIAVKSEVGKGTRFEIYLPLVADEPEINVRSEADAHNALVGTETILLVEDEETVRDLSREVLESCGYMVLTARDGLEALEILKTKGSRVSLMMTDVVMPNMGGRELAETAVERFPNMKILFSSGYDDHEIVKQGVLKEGTNFIQKPFSFDALALKVRELLDDPES